MIWTARTPDGAGRVLILTEFQGKPDPIMPLRTKIYSLLAVQEMLKRKRPALLPDSIEVLPPIVTYHGPGVWKGPTKLDEVLPHGPPREFRVIYRDPEGGGSGAAADLVEAMSGLDRDTSVEGTVAGLGRLQRIAGETDDRLDRLLADRIGAWLVSKERITEEQKQEAKTMSQVMTEYERSLEEFGRKRWSEGLCRLAAGRFGADTGERLALLLGTPPDSGRLATTEAAILDCTTAAELLRRVEGSGD